MRKNRKFYYFLTIPIIGIFLGFSISSIRNIGFHNSNLSTYSMLKSSQPKLISLNGSIDDNFNVTYDNSHLTRITTDTMFGRDDGYWNISFSDFIPQFSNYSQYYVSDINSFTSDINSMPTNDFSSNGIDLDYYDFQGNQTNDDLEFNNIISTYGESSFKPNTFGFSYNENDPISLTSLSKTLPLLKLSYQYLWNNNSFSTLPNYEEFLNYDNKWAFNNYVGITKDYKLAIFKPTDLPSINSTEQDLNFNLTASEFLNRFDEYKKQIKINVTNYLPVEQFIDLTLEANDVDGQVILKYKVKNTIDKNNNWYSDLNNNEQPEQSVVIASGFITNTTVRKNVLDGKIFTQGFLPQTVTDDVFTRWIFNNRNNIFSSLPPIQISNIKITDKQVGEDSVSYVVHLSKYYKNGQIIDDGKFVDFGRVTINNFKQIIPTKVEIKEGYENETFKLGNETHNWSTATPAFIAKIINTNSSIVGDDNKETIIKKLAKITGDISNLDNQLSSITDVVVDGIFPTEGRIRLKFTLNHGFVIEPTPGIKKNLEFILDYDNLDRIYPTKQIQNINVIGYDEYLISSISNNPNVDLINKLKQDISNEIISAYNDPNNFANYGQIPEGTIVTEITFDEASSNNEDGSIGIKYKLNKYIDDSGEIVPNEFLVNHLTNVSGFYRASPSLIKSKATVPNQENISPNLNWLTIENLKNAGLELLDIIDNTFTNVKLFNNDLISLNELNDSSITIEPKRIDLNQGSIIAKISLKKGFKLNQDNKIDYFNTIDDVFVDEFVFDGFKSTLQPVIKDEIEIDVSQVNELQELCKSIPQLIFNDSTSIEIIKNKAKEIIFNNLTQYVENIPEGILIDDIIITKEQDNNFINRQGIINLTFKFNKCYDTNTGQLIEPTDDFAIANNLKKKITITGFNSIQSSTKNEYVINNPELQNIYASDFTIDQAKQMIETNETKQAISIPNINIDQNPSISAIGIINYPPNISFIKEQGVNNEPILKLNIEVQNIYESTDQDIIYSPNTKINLTISFTGFKSIQNATIKPEANLSSNPIINQNYAQYWVMDNDPNSQATTIAELNRIVNEINEQTDNIIDAENKKLLSPNAKLVINLEKPNNLDNLPFNNQEGYLIANVYLSHIYNEFHEEIENVNPNNSEIRLIGFKKILNPTYIDGLSIQLANDPIFGNDIIYDDLISDEMIINKLNDLEFRKKFINDPNTFTTTFNNQNVQINRDPQNSLIDVVINTPGIDNDLIELNPNYDQPFNQNVSTKITFITNNSGSTTIKNDLENIIIQNKYVDELINLEANTPSLKDSNQLLQDIKTFVPNVKDLFDTRSGRIDQNMDWSNISSVELFVKNNKITNETNAATGTIGISLIMTSGFYFENNVRTEASVDNPKIFNTTIHVSNKRPITGISNDISFKFSDIFKININNINELYPYQLLKDNGDDSIKENIINYLKDDNNLSKILVDNNANSTPGQNPWISNPFTDQSKNDINLIANNKDGEIIVELTLNANKDSIYGWNGFKAENNMRINKTINVVIELNNKKTLKAKPIELSYVPNNDNKKILKVANKESVSIDDLVSQYKTLNNLIINSMHEAYEKQISGDESLKIFNNLNVNENKSYTLEQFMQWISVDTSKAKIERSGMVTNVSISINNQYFADDKYYTWIDKDNNKPLRIDGIDIIGFGKQKEIIWPIIVAACVGTVAFLVVILVVLLIIKRKSKIINNK